MITTGVVNCTCNTLIALNLASFGGRNQRQKHRGKRIYVSRSSSSSSNPKAPETPRSPEHLSERIGRRKISKIPQFENTPINWNDTSPFGSNIFKNIILPRALRLPVFRVLNDEKHHGEFIFGAQPGLLTTTGRFRPVTEADMYKALRALQAFGVVGLINMRGPRAADSLLQQRVVDRINKNMSEREQLRYESFALKFHPHEGLELRTANRILGLFKSHQHSPMFVHCYGGADRSGLVASLYAISKNIPFMDVCLAYYATGHGYLQNPVGNGFNVLANTVKNHPELRPYYLANMEAVDAIRAEFPQRDSGYENVPTNRFMIVDNKPQPIMTYMPLDDWRPVIPHNFRRLYLQSPVGGQSSISTSVSNE